MMLEQLRKQVCEANCLLPKLGLVSYTWGNVSGIDRESGLVVIKPSGVEYDQLTPENMVIVDLDGKVVEGTLRPSSDTPTHVVLYRAFPECGGITHTHSTWATICAQAGLPVRALGTTHADYFRGAVPCTRKMTAEEIAGAYEANTGEVIAETFRNGGISPEEIRAALVFAHGPFTWGKDAAESVEISSVLEQVAMMAYHTELIRRSSGDPEGGASMPDELLAKHFDRKHGKTRYYGQN